jgi:glutamate--cysteine ligase
VRLKRYLEMRGADSAPWRRLPALPAYWVGLLYDDVSLDAAWDMVKGWSAEDRQKLRDQVPRLGLKAATGRRSALELAKLTLDLSEQGLRRRRQVDGNGHDEAYHLRPLREYLDRGITPAEELLEKFHGLWGRSVEPVFDEYAY